MVVLVLVLVVVVVASSGSVVVVLVLVLVVVVVVVVGATCVGSLTLKSRAGEGNSSALDSWPGGNVVN